MLTSLYNSQFHKCCLCEFCLLLFPLLNNVFNKTIETISFCAHAHTHRHIYFHDFTSQKIILNIDYGLKSQRFILNSWFSILSLPYNHLDSLLKHRLLGSRISDSVSQGKIQELIFITSSQVMMMVLILGLGLENYCPKCAIYCPALWTKVLQNVLQISIIHHITTLFIKNLGSHMTIIQGMLYNIVSMSFPNHFFTQRIRVKSPQEFYI